MSVDLGGLCGHPQARLVSRGARWDCGVAPDQPQCHPVSNFSVFCKSQSTAEPQPAGPCDASWDQPCPESGCESRHAAAPRPAPGWGPHCSLLGWGERRGANKAPLAIACSGRLSSAQCCQGSRKSGGRESSFSSSDTMTSKCVIFLLVILSVLPHALVSISLHTSLWQTLAGLGTPFPGRGGGCRTPSGPAAPATRPGWARPPLCVLLSHSPLWMQAWGGNGHLQTHENDEIFL